MLLQALISIDPVRAREDPVIVKNIPYYKAKKALEAEVMKLDPPPRPQNWGVSIFTSPCLLIPTFYHMCTSNYSLMVERKPGTASDCCLMQ